MTVTGRTLGENLERWTHEHGELSFTEQDVIRPLENPIKETGHLRYVFNSLNAVSSPLIDTNLAQNSER